MKILLVHNDYGKYSGEEAVVDKMKAMLENHGHIVVQYRRSSVEIEQSRFGKIKAFFDGIYSPSGVKGMRDVLLKEKPDVVNVHNLYPFISPASLFECRKLGIPVVMTVHNYRLICPTGLLMRDGNSCELCLNAGNEWRCVCYNCEHSFAKSIGYAIRNMMARIIGAYKKNVDYFACLTDFQRKLLISAGYDAQCIGVIPNSIEIGNSCDNSAGDYVAFCGRISSEKGVDMIINVARKHPNIPFKLAGCVRDESLVKDLPSNVQLMGYLKDERLAEFYIGARFVVMASRCYEGFPMSVLEAAKYSKCSICPNHGGFYEIIGTERNSIGKLFAPCDESSLEMQVVSLWNDVELAQRLGTSAYDKVKKEYSSDVIYKHWESLFQNLIK